MFIVAVCTVVRTWKPPECLSTEEWVKEMRYVYTMEYYSDTKTIIITSEAHRGTQGLPYCESTRKKNI